MNLGFIIFKVRVTKFLTVHFFVVLSLSLSFLLSRASMHKVARVLLSLSLKQYSSLEDIQDNRLKHYSAPAHLEVFLFFFSSLFSPIISNSYVG